MFDKKKTQLFEEPTSNEPSNDPFVDDFASCSNFKQPREIKDILLLYQNFSFILLIFA